MPAPANRRTVRRVPRALTPIALATAALALTGCSNAGEGAFSGAALGALGGLTIGSLSGDAGEGAAIGAVSGAIVGGVIGDQNNRNARRSDHAGGYHHPPRRPACHDRGW
jgi:uncharacterized protein YcfJ